MLDNGVSFLFASLVAGRQGLKIYEFIVNGYSYFSSSLLVSASVFIHGYSNNIGPSML